MNFADPLRPTESSDPEDGMSDMPGEEALPEDQIITQKKKIRISSGTLLMLGLLAAVGGATYLMILRASAQNNAPNANAVAADTTINTFLTGGVQSFRQKIAMLEDTKKTVLQFNASPASHQVPLTDLHTDPFANTEVKEVAAAPLSEDAAARQAEEARKAAADLAGSLKLQSIIFGTHSGCMINGRSYAEGKGNGQFVVEKIAPRSVVVRIGGQRFELTMTPPPQPQDQ